MRAASLVLLLASVACGSNHSRRHDVTKTTTTTTTTTSSDDDHTEEPRCEYIPYPDHLPFLPDTLPAAALVRRVANDTAHALAAWITNDVVDWKKVATQAKGLLEMYPETVAASTFAVPEHHLGVVAYRQGEKVAVLPLSRNQSAPTEKYWRDAVGVGGEGKWSMPFLDCLTGKWIFGYSVLVPVQKKNRSTLAVYQYIDRCNESYVSAFGGSHKCDPVTTKCVAALVGGSPFPQDLGYACACRPGFFANSSQDVLEDDSRHFRCVACQGMCQVCDKNGRCMALRDLVLRASILAVQSVCMAITLVLGIVVFRKRKCKTISTGMWTILETILVGIFILYGTVVVKFFDPSKEQCLIEPWVRELGFVVCYGAIILKLYRILIEFRTRKAHRWVVRDKDLLKYLLGMIVMAVGYMSAWTAATLNFIQEDYSITKVAVTEDGLQFLTCKSLWWDYVTQTGEILILIFGIHLSFACRNAATQFQERRFLCLAIVVEAVVSGVYYILRYHYAESLHPDLIYTAYFARSQLTSTIVLLLIFTPKLWYQHKQVTDSRGANNLMQESSARIPIDAFKPQDGVAGSNNSDADVGDINLADMNPEDIRAELKRLYTQLEVLKNKTIRADNPHISKRRGGRKVAHRRFSLQKKGSREKALHHRHQRYSTRPHGHEHDGGEGEVSRTPEDSVCSVEGPSVVYNDGPSTYSDMGYATPNVSSRGSHKQ